MVPNWQWRISPVAEPSLLLQRKRLAFLFPVHRILFLARIFSAPGTVPAGSVTFQRHPHAVSSGSKRPLTTLVKCMTYRRVHFHILCDLDALWLFQQFDRYRYVPRSTNIR